MDWPENRPESLYEKLKLNIKLTHTGLYLKVNIVL
jgi:hypothetical protein